MQEPTEKLPLQLYICPLHILPSCLKSGGHTG